jgi:Mycothiol maleylpyruvate isomerase N-terminal domain
VHNTCARGGSSSVARGIGWVAGSVMPSAAPLFDTMNAVIPKALGRVLSPQGVKAQFAAGARNTRRRLQQVGPDDYTRPVYFEGGPYPLAFYIGIIVNELAIHGWDIESKIAQAADLSHHARRVLPWFYWGSTPLMLHPRKYISGTVQVFLSDPESAMWWSFGDGSVTVGRGITSHQDAQIRGSGSSFVLAVAGRINPVDAVDSLLNVEGNRNLVERFLGSWQLI